MNRRTIKQRAFLGCMATAALTAAVGVSACGSPAPSHAPPAAPTATETARGSVKNIPFYQPSTVHSQTEASATLTSPDPVTKVSDYYVSMANTGGWTIVSKSITSHSGNLTLKRSGQGATIAVAPSGSGSLISINAYPTG
jgi:hypothetical protein